jgi:hypothetical protein
MAHRNIGIIGAGAALALALAAAAPLPAQVFEVDDRLIPGQGILQAEARSGAALAAGDLDGDGRPDLAIAAPLRDELAPTVRNAGTVFVARFQPGRNPVELASVGGESLHANAGTAMALGDFDGDGDLELAVGEPGADAGNDLEGGVVAIWDGFGSAPRRLSQFTTGIGGDPEDGDAFGFALATGDFDGDGFDDLAIGVPREDVGTVADAGGVHVVFGSTDGLTGTGSQFLLLGQNGLPGGPGLSDDFGFALAAGDFDGDGFDDLAIGAPGTDLTVPTTMFDAGKVLVLHGSVAGITADGFLNLDEGDLEFGVTEEDDLFGFALAAGDFDRTAACVAAGTCADELAIGLPGESLGAGTDFAGKVMVMAGVHGDGLQPGDVATFTAASLGMPIQGSAHFGEVLAVGRLDGDLADDLAIGEPLRNFAASDEGMVYLMTGGANGLAASRSQQIVARTGLGSAPAREGDNFGAALAIADFDGDGHGDLAIGLPGRAIVDDGEELEDAGAVQVLFGAVFADGFESGTPNAWSPFDQT